MKFRTKRLDTFNQFSETMPAAIKTVPQTGGVIVDNNISVEESSSSSKTSNFVKAIPLILFNSIDLFRSFLE